MVEKKRNRTPYELWLEGEGIPVVGGNDIEDMLSVPLGPWKRMGGSGAYAVFEFCRQFIDGYICEIPARGQLKLEKHLYEELLLILSGKGSTEVWIDKSSKQTFEWQEGSLFAIPLNTHHQLFNGSNQPARILGVTTAPSMINAFHNLDFIFNNDFAFKDRFASESDYFSGKAKTWDTPEKVSKVWETNFIADVKHMELFDFSERGAGGTNTFFQFAENSLVGHVSEFTVGTYKKGHRHPQVPGFLGVTLTGEGYSLVWDPDSMKYSEARNKSKIPWRENSLWTYNGEDNHQHFNTSPRPARYLAFYLGSRKYPGFGGWLERWTSYASTKEGGFNIDYEDEDSSILLTYQEELARKRLTIKEPISLWRK